ncbi:Rdx family-domain-containing protein, partial [Zychaea mexicana]|uniref:Rdx family-domain-containing protein n=1 Tax=Zychaea mexicana TaxID=64656 RepID=UPI0022FE4991
RPRVSIEYCTKCRWMLRAAWMGQELLTTFDTLIGELAIIPGAAAVFQVKVNDVIIWDRKEKGRFPEVKELKQLIRDIIAPDMSLGHSDRKKEPEK